MSDLDGGTSSVEFEDALLISIFFVIRLAGVTVALTASVHCCFRLAIIACSFLPAFSDPDRPTCSRTRMYIRTHRRPEVTSFTCLSQYSVNKSLFNALASYVTFEPLSADQPLNTISMQSPLARLNIH